MRQSLRLFIAAASICGAAGTAHAADLITYPTSTEKALPVSSTAPGFDWSGFYAGIYGVGQRSPVGGDQYGIGIDAGVSTTFNFALIGAEVAVEGLTGGNVGTTAYVEGLGRAGILLTDNTLLYGAAGYGGDVNTGEQDVLAGGGLEFAVNDALSLRAQYLHGFPVTGSNPKDQITLGAQFHF